MAPLIAQRELRRKFDEPAEMLSQHAEQRLKRAVPLASLACLPLARALVVPRTEPGPRGDAWVREHYCSLSSWIFRKPWGDGEKIITIELVQRNVCDRYGVKLSELTAKNRTKSAVFPCQVAMYLSRHLSPMPPSPRSAARSAAKITRVCSMPSRRSKR